MVGQRSPTPHLTALAYSSLQLCFSLGEPTGNPRAREPRRGREWICGERGTVEKLPIWVRRKRKSKETVRTLQLKQQAIFWVKKDEARTTVSSKGVF